VMMALPPTLQFDCGFRSRCKPKNRNSLFGSDSSFSKIATRRWSEGAIYLGSVTSRRDPEHRHVFGVRLKSLSIY
jgi:hypothetical protein